MASVEPGGPMRFASVVSSPGIAAAAAARWKLRDLVLHLVALAPLWLGKRGGQRK